MLLVRLGLRAGEVVVLNLEDLNWEDGLIRIRRKGAVGYNFHCHRTSVMPPAS
jgi:integrase